MPRQHKRPVAPITLSPTKLAAALDVHTGVIAELIANGDLKVYTHRAKRHCLVNDAIELVRSWPEAKRKPRK
jgi:hypothetical protein